MSEMNVPQIMQLAMRQHQAGRLADAEKDYRQVLSVQPDHSDALHLLGVLEYQQGKLEQALQHIQRAIQIQPAAPHYYGNLGLVLEATDRIDDAIAAQRRALSLHAEYPEALNNLGNLLLGKRDFAAAIEMLQKALALRPHYPEGLNNLGNAFREMGRIDSALDCFHRAISLRPQFAPAHLSLGASLIDKGEIRQAISHLRQAIAIEPDSAEAHHNLGAALLLMGDFENGWIEYEWRLRMKKVLKSNQQFSRPIWNGEPLNGRKLLIRAEQGFGDTIQFCRFIPMIAKQAGKLAGICPPELIKLLRCFEDVEWRTTGDSLPDFDVHCSLMSLPRILKTTEATIPSHVPYLKVDPILSSRWRKRLNALPGMKVGLAWAGRSEHARDRERSISPTAFKPLMSLPNIQGFSLQKVDGISAISSLASDLNLIDWTNELNDFADSAALIDNLDLVITVDTAIAHLAGALGKKCWTLLPFAPDWRWMLARDDSPWYPTMRLFRQPAIGDWNSVISQITRELACLK
ncbi:MAG TPA: tetratricopeptide repeat protein [Tepidisphaeraceae bacterium]|nr:tetratricopeptide repeat protein [Tepidisphaeraceae bacterium]